MLELPSLPIERDCELVVVSGNYLPSSCRKLLSCPSRPCRERSAVAAVVRSWCSIYCSSLFDDGLSCTGELHEPGFKRDRGGRGPGARVLRRLVAGE